MLTIDKVLDEIQKHPIEVQEIIEELLHKRLIEEKREMIYSDYLQAREDLKNGNIKFGSINDLFKALK